MEKIKRVILLAVPTSICNFRCSYCYLSQRDICFQGKQAEFKYSPQHVAAALSKERLGGTCYINICADGETLLTKDIEQYIYELAKAGHYIEIVTNLTVTPVINNILRWEKNILNHITFKCSFHYLQLKEKGMLSVFAENVKRIWDEGCSASVEMTPHDELIPYIEEIIAFSMDKFGALPHLTLARNDKDNQTLLTDLEFEEYKKVWSQFDSEFWRYKLELYQRKRREFCYAGSWSLYVNLATGDTSQCYCSRYHQNVFENPEKSITFLPIGKCGLPYCYNGHALLTLGCIPGAAMIGYGDIRNRIRNDGKQWIQSEMLEFLNSKAEDSNRKLSWLDRKINRIKILVKNAAERL